MLLTEGLSKFSTLVVIAWISIELYKDLFPGDQVTDKTYKMYNTNYLSDNSTIAEEYARIFVKVPFHRIEKLLAVQVWALVMYEIGRYYDDGLSQYIETKWSLFDVIGLLLAFIWFFTRSIGFSYHKNEIGYHYDFCRGSLASSAIFYCLSMLKYLSMYNEYFGEMIILILNMAYEVFLFMFVWMAFLVGAYIFFLSLFKVFFPYSFLYCFSSVYFYVTRCDFIRRQLCLGYFLLRFSYASLLDIILS